MERAQKVARREAEEANDGEEDVTALLAKRQLMPVTTNWEKRGGCLIMVEISAQSVDLWGVGHRVSNWLEQGLTFRLSWNHSNLEISIHSFVSLMTGRRRHRTPVKKNPLEASVQPWTLTSRLSATLAKEGVRPTWLNTSGLMMYKQQSALFLTRCAGLPPLSLPLALPLSLAPHCRVSCRKKTLPRSCWGPFSVEKYIYILTA